MTAVRMAARLGGRVWDRISIYLPIILMGVLALGTYWLVRNTPPKPLRIFLQTGSNDLDVVIGSWPIANHDMASALAYSGYDYEFVFGEGGHTLIHGAAIFPDTMRWLWREYSQPAPAASKQRHEANS